MKTIAVVIDGEVYERVENFSHTFNPLDMCMVEGSTKKLDDSFDFVGWYLPDKVEALYNEMQDNEEIYWDIVVIPKK